jgi:hypothetical protein
VSRAPVDVVIPFAGSAVELDALLARLEPIALGPDDTLVVADNRREADQRTSTGEVKLVAAPATRSSYYARNAGAGAGHAPWLLFLDADVEWDGTLLDAYFEPAPEDRVAVLAGTIEDAPVRAGAGATLAERYAVAARTMSDQNTLAAPGRPPYAQTANCMVRRAAFEAIGGFEDGIRSGGDADLCWRLAAGGWEIERRAGAHAVHRNRRTVKALLAQKARHGSGAAWLDRRHPGTFPRRSLLGLTAWSARSLRDGLTGAAAHRGTTLLSIAAVWAFELGRLSPNRAAGLRRRAAG